MPIYAIIGELVALGPVDEETGRALSMRARNDFATQRTANKRAPRPVTPDTAAQSYSSRVADDRNVRFLIYERATGTAIGTASLHRVDHWNGTAMFGISIADPAARGKGYGTEAARLTLDYAFTALGLHNVSLGAIAVNPGAIRAYEKAGFREIGRRRQSWRVGTERYDEVLMDCLATEFESPVLRHILSADEPRSS